MRVSLAACVIALVWLLGACDPERAVDSCALAKPPRDSAVDANHGVFLFVFPRQLEAGYTGCQIMWDEKGNRLFTLTFEQGRLVSFELKDPGTATGEMCVYSDGTLTSSSRSDCPPYDDVKDGIATAPIGRDAPVPPDRDLRLK